LRSEGGMICSREDKRWLGGRRGRHQIAARRLNRTFIGRALALVLITSPSVAQSPFYTPRTTSAADSLEVLRAVANRMWMEAGINVGRGPRFFTPSQLAYEALYSETQARKIALDSIPRGQHFTVSCPFRMSSDSAGLNEKAGPKGFFVALVIIEIKDSVATAAYEVGCGAGGAPISGFLQGGKYKLVRWRNHWVIDAIIDRYIT
jgi:hypothetical protein